MNAQHLNNADGMNYCQAIKNATSATRATNATTHGA
jgi:hypothetical protein